MENIMEIVRWTFFDTKELPEKGSGLDFFVAPNLLPNMSNWHLSGALPYPQDFLLYGLILSTRFIGKPGEERRAYPHNKCIKFIESAEVELMIGHKLYLQVPVISTVNGLVPEDAPAIYKNMFRVPEIKLNDWPKYNWFTRESTIAEDFEGPVAKLKPGDYFYGLCIVHNDEVSPLHIACQQQVRVSLNWAESEEYDSGILGKIRIVAGLPGILKREMQ